MGLFLSTTYLSQHPFDSLRQVEGDVTKRSQLSEPPVEARLWEDPFAALRRHHQKFKELCSSSPSPTSAAAPGAVPASASPSDPRCPMGQAVNVKAFKETFAADGDRVTLIAALLPGSAFSGVEEARRRTRYALLAGLNAEGYAPDDSEHMGLVQAPRCDRFSGCAEAPAAQSVQPRSGIVASAAPPSDMTINVGKQTVDDTPKPVPMEIVYETFTTTADSKEKKRRVAVLWIDDTTIGPRWLSGLTSVLKDLAPKPDVRLRIVGPTGSGALVAALGDDLRALQKEAAAAKPNGSDESKDSRTFHENWETLAKLRLISPLSTATAEELRRAARLPEFCAGAAHSAQAGERRWDCVEASFQDRFETIRSAFNGQIQNVERQLAPVPSPFFVRTIGTDDLLINRLVEELSGRGLNPCRADAQGRVALFGEWDSVYARALAEALEREVHCKGNSPKDKSQKERVEVDPYLYLRGLDGALLDGTPAQNKSGNDNPRATAGNTSQIEWPEGRGQRDYVRRLVQQILKKNSWQDRASQVQAIGMIGSDVHDKLILVQALREAFPDRMLFTTDMDARLLHPSVIKYTRNLIVASSLPLEWEDRSKNRIVSFRDAYQTATFLAARHAATVTSIGSSCQGKHEHALECRIEKAVMHPTLFEIGRNGGVELPAAGALPSEIEDRRIYATLAAFGLLAIGGLMMIGMPAPAMRATRLWLSAGWTPGMAYQRSTVIVAGLEVAALAFAAGVLAELAVPGSTGAWGAIVLAGAAALFFWTFVYPGTRWMQDLRASGSGRPLRLAQIGLQFVLLVAAAGALWWIVVWPGTVAEMHEPFDPFGGVSAWPSQLLRTLAVVVFAWSLDYAWCKVAATAVQIEEDYFPVAPGPAAATPMVRGWWGMFLVIRNGTIWFWRPRVEFPDGGINGARLWHEYRLLQRDGPRLGRLVFWVVVANLLVMGVMAVIGGATPEIPARGIADRALFWNTLMISVLGLVSLLVLVADATILTWRFVGALKRGRTVYPEKTVKRFAADLGLALRDKAAEPIAVRATDRVKSVKGAVDTRPAGQNSILDDWIDVQLLGQHTAAIGPLIVCPFILLALMVVARSQLFDNWQIGGSVLVVLGGYVLWSVAMAALLNYGAEMARQKALAQMTADQQWLEGAGDDYAGLAKRFPGLIEQVRTLRQGAFAPFFEQPLVRAILVPLGGAGGVQLLELLMYARAS